MKNISNILGQRANDKFLNVELVCLSGEEKSKLQIFAINLVVKIEKNVSQMEIHYYQTTNLKCNKNKNQKLQK